jgi:hypothetical protein
MWNEFIGVVFLQLRKSNLSETLLQKLNFKIL